MDKSMLHIWRNSPLGRENLLQSLYFCRKMGSLGLGVYRPVCPQGLMYFDNSVVTLELDKSYFAYPETSEQHAREILADGGVPWKFVEPAGFTAHSLPDLPNGWTMMSCPRVLSQSSGWIRLTHIGPKVRAIIKHATFPVFIPANCYKEWKRVAAFFGGSQIGLRAVRIAARVAEQAGVPLTIYTQLGNGHTRDELRETLQKESIHLDERDPEDRGAAPHDCEREWVVFESGALEENLYAVSVDSLVVVGAAGERSIRDLIFGGRAETIQSTLPNPLLVIGPDCRVAV